MKLAQKNKKTIKLPLVIVGILILVIGSYALFSYFNKVWPFPKDNQSTPVNKVDLNPPTKDQTNAGNDIKNAAQESESKPSPKGQVDVSITSTNQNTQTFQIRTLIQAITNSGSCTLTLTKGSTVVTKTSTVQAQSSASTCVGFDVPISELSAGTWKLDITFQNDSVNGSVSQVIEIS